MFIVNNLEDIRLLIGLRFYISILRSCPHISVVLGIMSVSCGIMPMPAGKPLRWDKTGARLCRNLAGVQGVAPREASAPQISRARAISINILDII
jgi:hypothetical protein